MKIATLLFVLLLTACGQQRKADARKWHVVWIYHDQEFQRYNHVDHLEYYPKGCLQFHDEQGKRVALGGGTFEATEE